MWERFPHVVLLIFANIIFNVSCTGKGNGSLTFLIDDTSSMGNDILQVRNSVNRIKNIVLHEKSSLIDNMVLVTFNDPGVHDRIVTKNPDAFKDALYAIRPHNEAKQSELDCWEPSMKGLLQALNRSENNSYIFVFTDAPSKDYINGSLVTEICQKKQTQIVFVLTGKLCKNQRYTPEAMDVYFDIALACTGLVIIIPKEKVIEVFGPIEEIIKGNKAVITTATVPAGDSKMIGFVIDDHTNYVIVTAYGQGVTLKINGLSAYLENVMSTDNAKVVKLRNVEPGNYTATVKSKSRTYISVVGRTDFFFVHGFSESKPKTLGDTSPQPKADTKVYLSISVSNEDRSVKIVAAKILDMDEKPIIKELPLKEISKDFYITDRFVVPSQMFKVVVDGIVIATKKSIHRNAKIPVTPEPRKIAPKLQGVSVMHVKKDQTAVLECKVVSGFPAPKITWLFGGKSGSKFTPLAPKVTRPFEKFTSLSYSGKNLRLSYVKEKQGGKYKCVAENEAGKDELDITLFVQDPPKIVTIVTTTYQSTEGDASLRIPCTVIGIPKPSITWKINGHVINPSAKYLMVDGALIIRDPKVTDTNSYTCEAKNEVGSAKATFKTYIRQAPQVSGVTVMKVRMGTPASLKCTIDKGEPKPTISWEYMANSGSAFSTIVGSDKVLRILRVENSHAGRYKCVARNGVGSSEHITTLDVQDLPKINSTHSSTYQSTEGDALLRIPCVAAGLPKPSITWKLNGRVINPSAKYSIEHEALIIRDPKVTDTNTYTCEAKNEVGDASATFRTYIRQVPKVSGVTLKKVKVGTPASIECTIDKGEPKPTISWEYMANSGSAFSTIVGSDKVLRILRVENSHAGRYKCVARNGVGSSEHITTLDVQDLPKINSTHSSTYQSTEGDALLRIPCVAAGLPKPSITWKLNGRVIDPSAKYSIEHEALIIRDPKVTDTNTYTCEAKNEVGDASATFRTYIRQVPKVSGVTLKKVKVGTPASIECTIVKGEPKPTISWEYMANSGSAFSTIVGSDKVLHILRVENSHAGRYKCVARNGVGSSEHITTLDVQDLPKINSTHSSVYQSTEGDALLRIPCVAAGLPKPSITWKLNGRVIDPSAKYSIEHEALIIRDPKVTDTNTYTCEAKNEVGDASATFRTYIRQAPKVSGVTLKKVKVGTPASIECTIDKGEPKPTISWEYMANSGSAFSTIVGSDKVLHILRVENSHAGRYKCVARNGVGSSEHITTLDVQDLPKINSTHSSTYQSTEGDALLRIPCVAAGLPKPSITWKLNGRVINPSAKYSIEHEALIIRDPRVTDTNTYTCEAKNEVGVASATFRTYIRQVPKVSGVTLKKVKVGTPASIECTIDKGEPKPTISWEYMANSGSAFSTIVGSDKVLRILRVENSHAGRYKCVARNGVGSSEHITTLDVQDLPKINSTHSSIYQSTEGDALLRIPCVAAGLPKPSITWKLNGRVINPSAKYSIEHEALIIRDPKVTDTNTYTCEAKNEVGDASATFRTYIRQVPKVSGVTLKKVKVGTPASIECTIDKGEPKPTISWEYMANSGSAFSTIVGSDKVLRILRVENSHAGRYKCVARNGVGSSEHITTLDVQDLPKINSTHSSIYQSTEGDALLRIPCVAAGLPKPSITWKLNGRVIDPSAKYSIEHEALIIRDPKVTDTNTYTCEAKNEVGVASATFRTYIRQVPRVSGVTLKKVKVGTPASIECSVEGQPEPAITWLFMGESDSKFLPVSGLKNVLHISNAENSHAGRYKCVAQNSVGSNEHITILVVESLPGITTHPTAVEGIEGDLALRLPCDVVGVPQPDITWSKNGTTITPDEKYFIEDGALVIVNPAKNDSASYTCEAKNHIGSVNTTFQAVVEEHPKSFGTEHYVYLVRGETRKLKCDAYSSKSESVKWFVTSPSELDPLETTTESSTDDSSTTTTRSSIDSIRSLDRMTRTITIDTGIQEPYIQIADASDFDHDGNYTCRVSDKHGNTQTNTYVVDVGDAPVLREGNGVSISNWEGEITDITRNCDLEEGNTAKPTPVVEWTFNGEVITDFNSAGIGHYTCNVSNVHGSENRKFNVNSSECLITRNLRNVHAQYMPLILNDKSWHKLKNTEHYIRVEQKQKITLSCPSQTKPNAFKNFAKMNRLEALCNKEDSFFVEGKLYKLSDLQCTNSIQPSVIRNKVKCSTDTSELIRVGYNVPDFLEAYEVCFDHAKHMPSYTRIIMTETNNNGLSAGYSWYTYPGIDSAKTNRGFTCKDTSSSCCYSKSQLVNAIDFNDGPAKKSTFIDPLNAIPVWLPCNAAKPTWENINDKVRSLLVIYSDIVAWSGTHTLQEINGTIIPRYLWKVLRLGEDGVAIVNVNDPTPTEKDIKCKSNCSKYETDYYVDFSDEYTYCCSLSEFFKEFDIHIDIKG